MKEVLQAPSDSAPFQESLEPGVAPGPGSVSIHLDQRFQTLEGFGASVAWYQDRISGVVPEGLYDFLFPELGLDILRFRNRFERSDEQDANLKQEVTIFERASQALGHRPKLLLSAWSPPARLKASGKEKCKGNPDCTLKKEGGQFLYAGFADWWKRSIEHYRSLGLNPDWISIQNEPDFVPPDWEGCKFGAEESADFPGYGTALRAVHQAIASLPSPPALLGPEVLGIHYGKLQRYLAGLDPSLLVGVAHHIYERGNDGVWDWRDPGPESFEDEMAALRQATDKPTFQTEFQTDEDKGIDGGFETAWLIYDSLVVQGAVSFLYWNLIWADAGGLVGMKGLTPQPRDQYYSLRHYARFTDPGYVRVAAEARGTGLLASAFVAPDASRLSIVLLNTSRQALDVSTDPGGFQAAPAQAFVTSYRPGASQRWREQAVPPAGKLRLPARAVATLVYQR